ncbi:phosphotransferase [Paenibacillus radicis (ex Xue et al. 2023)]|uniref:Phosphotransferase n=1 Tax=Paenibacillus radicis (ex Xue et al. 2023) TaxID=2972489 RepID=A0ABT1YI98_9BACL|nr:phosphotransferase [Paenibacillus radicis (ex Xue et al. 2023)]MCR8632896.1 phosphotransferase [Paenibacillus radicis (ex Xue et al. 2023)]
MGTSGHLSNDVLFAIKYLSEWFPIGKLKGIGRKLGGSYNINIKVETSRGEFVVRILNRSNTEEHLHYTQKVFATLSEHGVPVLNPILTSSGDPFINYKDKLLQVTPFVRADAFQCRHNQVRASARTLSVFHQSLQNTRPGPEPDWSFYRSRHYFMNTIDLLKNIEGIPKHELKRVEKLAEHLLETWEESQDDLPTGIIHGDWHFWNQLYKSDEVYCVMDFDFIQQGKRVHDIAYALWAIYILLPDYAKTFDEIFIKGYANLTEEELKILPIAIAKVSLFFLCQAAYSSTPAEKWRKQYRRQMPLMEWLLADGERRMYEAVHGKKEEPILDPELDPESESEESDPDAIIEADPESDPQSEWTELE